MRSHSRVSAVFAAAVAATILASCKRAPEEQPTSHDPSSPPAPQASAGETASRDASVEQGFCVDAFTADVDRLRAKCAPTELELTQSLARMAAKTCANDIESATSQGRAAFRPEAAAKCVEMLRATPLVPASETDTLFSHAPCDRVLEGNQREGAACRFSVQCADQLACVGYKIAGDGTCRKPPAVNQSCTPQVFGTILNAPAAALHHPACAAGAWCDAGTCKPRVADGGACTTGDACAEGRACVMGKCGARVAAGGACAKKEDCAYGAWCDAGKCAATKGEGAPCKSVDECNGRCDIPKADAGAPSIGKCVAVCGSG